MASNRTESQKAAINSSGKLTVVSAAAGSGKTTVLVEKAVNLLADEDNKLEPHRLLIATFSNASAKEFRNRIEKELNKRIKHEPNNTYLKTQKMALQKADISTIHSFYIKLVRENFEMLNISPSFTICDDAKGLVLHNKAINDAMEYGYSLDGFKKYSSLFGKSGQDIRLREFLKEMYYYFSALPFPKTKAVELFKISKEADIEKTQIYLQILKTVKTKITYCVYLARRQLEIYELGEFEGYEEGLTEDLIQTQKLELAFVNSDIDKMRSISATSLATLKKAKPKCDSSTNILEVRKRLKDILNEINEDLEYLNKDTYKSQSVQSVEYINDLTKVFIYYWDRILEIKKQERAFEFSDFEHFAIELLVNEKGEKTPLAQALQEKYLYIMEDEFQDTSYVQDLVFKTIAKEGEKNLFIVGDVKQSIYGFRKASPEIFLEKRQRGFDNPDTASTIILPDNFRSEAQVIIGVNYLFNRVMTTEIGGVDYIKNDQLKVPDNKEKSENVGVKIAIYPQQEIENVANTIHDMISSGYKIIENGELRSVQPKDFCILLRNKSKIQGFAKALTAMSYTVSVKDDEMVLNKPEIQTILSVLRIINNPQQEVYLTAGMFGDIFEFSLDEILKIRINSRKQNLYKSLVSSNHERALELLENLKDFSYAAGVYSIDKLIDYIIKKTSYYTRLAFSENAQEKRENVRWLIAFARDYAKAYQRPLESFLRYVDMYIESGKGGGSEASAGKNSISIMTMHNSKGLEFPVCFVSGLSTMFNKRDGQKKLMMDTTLGMATFVGDKFGVNRSTAGIKAIKEKILANDANEEMRLLYVAATRAKNLLVFTCQYSRDFNDKTIEKIQGRTGKIIHPYALQRATTPMEWVITGYLDHPAMDFGRLAAVNKLAEDFLTFTIGTVQENDITQAALVQEVYSPPKDEMDNIIKSLEWEYPDKAKTKLPIKMSVGEIAKAIPMVSLPTPFFARELQVTAVERGVAMHKLMQWLDITLARQDLSCELSRLDNAKVIEKDLINVKQLERFIKSSVSDIIAAGEQVYTEKEFLVPYNAGEALNDKEYENQSLLIQGVIDCLVITNGEAVVIDYKTDKALNMQVLYDRYYKQLKLYKYAAEYLYDVSKVRCILYSFYLDDYIEF